MRFSKLSHESISGILFDVQSIITCPPGKESVAAVSTQPATPLTRIQWAVCAAAGIGFAFDLYESLMNTLVVGPMLITLGGMKPGTAEFSRWVGLFFFIPALAAGIFGLLGGYLTDVFGRRRVLVWSILLYSFSCAAAAFAQSLPILLLFRCTTMIGVSVEAVAATAWLAELFSHPKQRESVLGYTQACYALGGIMVSGMYYMCVSHAGMLPAILGEHEAWRYTLLSGLIPAIPLLVLRPFLPESPLWLDRRHPPGRGRPRFSELFKPALRRGTLLSALAMACVIAIPAGALQQSPRIVPGMANVAHLSTQHIQQWVSIVLVCQEIGSAVGRLVFPLLINRVKSRLWLLRTILVMSLALMPVVFLVGARHGLVAFAVGMFFIQALFNMLHSFWGNYLPRLFPTRIRGTGESFAMNIGGRAVGTFAAVVSTQLALVLPGPNAGLSLATACGITVTAVLLLFVAASWRMQDPKTEHLPE
jgi:predicted MFS family arabinose efflux permease